MEYKSFESAMEHLKKVIFEFESNKNITIDELLTNYEEGLKAYSFCAKKLDDTQKKIKVIDETFDL